MGLSDVGNLMCLPVDEIEPGPQTDAHDYLIQEASNLLQASQRNWIPIIVKETGVDEYEVIANSFVYEAVLEAGLEKVWCIIADDSPDTALVSSVLANDVVPKVNLSTATHKQIANALDYLIKQPGTLLKGVSVATASARIEDAPRKYWQTLEPITKLKCRLTKSKLKELRKVFYLEPEPLPDVITDITLLDTFTATELKKMAKKRGLKGYSSLKKSDLIKRLSQVE